MKSIKLMVIILATLCSLLTTLLYSQVDTAWVRRYNGPGNSGDAAYAIAVDDLGNVYITGTSEGDYATIKYYSNSDTAWVRRYNGPGNSEEDAWAIAVDNSGNVYVTGGSGSFPNYDYATIKYYSNGDTAWVRRYNGPGNEWDEATAIAVDNSGNVYVTGGSEGGYTTIKYYANGDTAWVRRYPGAASAIAVDNSGNVYVTGSSPGSGTYYDYATIKYNSNGDTVWVRRYNEPGNGADVAYAMAVDRLGNIYVTGYSFGSGTDADYATIKYYANGDTAWVRRYNGLGNWSDEATAIAVDNSGNVYVTGYSFGSGTIYDYATLKYYANGATAWIRRYNGTGNDYDRASAIAVDNSGNVYVTGNNCSSVPDIDYATIKYYANGETAWVRQYNGPGNSEDDAWAIAVDNSGNVYVTGSSFGSGSDDYATIKYVQGQGIEENRLTLHSLGSTLEVYPNPAKAFFTLRLPQSVGHEQIKIYDVTGKIVKKLESSGNRELRVSLNGIKNGVYFVKVGDEIVKEKLVVTR